MPEPTLFVIVINYQERSVHHRIRERLRFYGDEVIPGMFEAFLPPAELARLRKVLLIDAQEGDTVRVYPVCSRCRSRATSLGQEPFAEPTDVIIF